MRPNVKRVMKIAPLAILGLLLFVALGGAIVLNLWNWLLPALFGWPAITFWQALGLLALSRILFGGLGLNGGPRSRFRRHRDGGCEAMTGEDRERFRQRIRERWGVGAEAGESPSS